MKTSANIDLVTFSPSVPTLWAVSPVPVTRATKAMVSPARVSFQPKKKKSNKFLEKNKKKNVPV